MTEKEITEAAAQFYSLGHSGAVLFDVHGFANTILQPVEAERDAYKQKLDDLTAQVLAYAKTVLKEVKNEVQFQETLTGGAQ